MQTNVVDPRVVARRGFSTAVHCAGPAAARGGKNTKVGVECIQQKTLSLVITEWLCGRVHYCVCGVLLPVEGRRVVGCGSVWVSG